MIKKKHGYSWCIITFQDPSHFELNIVKMASTKNTTPLVIANPAMTVWPIERVPTRINEAHAHRQKKVSIFLSIGVFKCCPVFERYKNFILIVLHGNNVAIIFNNFSCSKHIPANNPSKITVNPKKLWCKTTKKSLANMANQIMQTNVMVCNKKIDIITTKWIISKLKFEKRNWNCFFFQFYQFHKLCNPPTIQFHGHFEFISKTTEI